MAMTLQEMKAQYPNDPMRIRLIDNFLDGSESVVLPRLNFVDSSDALGYQFASDDSVGGIEERSINGTYTASNEITNPQRETLGVFGGKIKTDMIFVDAKGEAARLERIDRRMRRAGKYFDKVFFHGDSTVNAKQFNGLRRRSILKSRVSYMGANGAALTLDALDEGLDKVSGANSRKVIFCDRWMRRKITALLRAAAGGKQMAETQQQLQSYNDAPIVTLDEDESRNPVFAFNETRGSSAVTASLYIVRFGDGVDGQDVQGIRGPSWMKLRVPVNQGTYVEDNVDNVAGMVDFDKNCFWRIAGILQS